MVKIDLVLNNVTSGELDRIPLEVKDPEECGREVMAALAREQWVLSVGDRIEVVPRGAVVSG